MTLPSPYVWQSIAAVHCEDDDVYRQLFDGSGQAIVVTDRDGRVVCANPAACRLFDRDRADVLARGLAPSVDAADPRWREAMAARGAGRNFVGELAFVRPDGTPFAAGVTLNVYRDDAGREWSATIVRDVTERRHADDTRAQLEARLRDVQKMEAIGTFAAGIANDFNEIVAAIVGNVELARHAIDNGLSASDNLDEIRKAGQRARDIVEQILTFSQRGAPKRALVALTDVVAEAATLLRPSLPARVELVVDCAGAPPHVWADATQLHRVLMNLATNAAYAMEGRGGTIMVRIDNLRWDDMPESARASLAPGRYARLSVIDTGKGMDAGTKARAFEPFFTTKPAGEGTGLGLAVVHGIVTSHGGLIVVESAPACGTRFDLYFPAADAADAAAARPGSHRPAQRAAAHAGRILYVDDDDALAFLASRLLRRSGFDVTTSRRADEALGLVRANPHRFDLVVTDVNMPGLSGLEMARELRGLNDDLPVVLTSGHVSERLRADAAAIGVHDIVYKQNTVEELCALVEEIARRRCAGSSVPAAVA